MATLNQLTLNGDGTIDGTIRHDAGTGSPFYTHCNDDPTSSSSDYVENDNSESSGNASFALTAVNSNFESMSTLNIDVDVWAETAVSDDTITLTAQIYSADDAGGVALTAETASVGTHADTTRTQRQVSFGTLTGTKAQWDGAYIIFRWTYSKSGGPDNANLRLYGCDIDGTYVVALPFIPEVPAFRFYDDDGSESGSTALANQDINVDVDAADADDLVHLRLLVEETGGGNGLTTDDWQLQYRKNAGSWLNVNSSSSNVQSAKGTAGSLPTLENSTQSIPGSLGTSITLTKPTSPDVVTGDLLILIVYNDATGSSPEFDDDVTGWNFFATFKDANPSMHLAMYWRIADETEPSTVDVTAATSAGMVGFYVVYGGTDTGNPFGSTLFSQTTPANTTHVLDEITTERDNSLILYFDGIDGDSRQPVSVASPYTERDEAEQTVTGGLIGISFGDQNLATAGASGDAVLTYFSGDTGGGMLIAIQPTFTPVSQLTDGAVTTDRSTGITNPGSGSFVAGEQESNNGLIEDHRLTGDNFTEHVFALKLISADLVDTNTLGFRLLLNGSTITNAFEPVITIDSGGGPTSSSTVLVIMGTF